MEAISEHELIQIQNRRYGASFWVSPNGQVTQVARQANGEKVPQIEALKSSGHFIDQTKR